MSGISFRMKVCVYLPLALFVLSTGMKEGLEMFCFFFCISLIFSHSLTWGGGRNEKRFTISSEAMIPQLQNCDTNANFTVSPGELNEMAAVQRFPQSRSLINGSNDY